jgi:hypothetical protein
VESENLHDAAALAEFWNSSHELPAQPLPAAAAHSPPPNEEAWVVNSNSRNTRSQKAAPPKATAPPTKKKNYTPVLASTISDDEEEELPETSTPEASKRTPDRGDFNVNDDKAITGYFKNNLRDSSISDSQRDQLVKKIVTIWSTANPDYHKSRLGNNFTSTNKLGRLLVNALKNDTSLLKGLFACLDKHIAGNDSNIKDLEVTISGMISTQQHQKETAAANIANKKAAAKTNTTTQVTAPTNTDTTTPTDKQNPKPKGTAFQQYFNHHTTPSTTSITTTNSPPTNTSTASSTDTSTASDSATSTASGISTAVDEGSGTGDGSSSSKPMSVEGDDPVPQ